MVNAESSMRLGDAPRTLGQLIVLLVCIAQAGCELTEVTVPEGDPIVVVHAIMRPDTNNRVLLEWSLTGRLDPHEVFRDIPPDQPEIPLDGASVTVANLDFVDPSCDSAVVLPASAVAGLYADTCPTIRPGDRLSLHVETPQGEVVTGTTLVPEFQSIALKVGGDSVTGPIRFNRDRDTLKVQVIPAHGRAIQVEAHDFERDSLTLFLFVDTMGVAVPGNFVNPFGGENDQGEQVFRAGRVYDFAVALLDSSYFDFLRSANDPFAGRGFITRLEGGLGVFGSMVVERYAIEVVGDIDDPREGAYLLEGTLFGEDVSLRWELYLERSERNSPFSAFVTVTSSFSRSLDRSMDGRFAGDSLRASLPLDRASGPFAPTGRYFLTGVHDGARPFQAVVQSVTGERVGSLTVTRP